LEQKAYAWACLSSTHPDPIETEEAESYRQIIMKKLEDLQRVENVQRIRVTVCN